VRVLSIRILFAFELLKVAWLELLLVRLAQLHFIEQFLELLGTWKILLLLKLNVLPCELFDK
jgi:hypothetical protein